MELKDLTPEQRERVEACKTQEEFMALAEELDLDLTPEQLEAVSGGKGKLFPADLPGILKW